MTEATGQKSTEVEAPSGPPPWERAWNSVTETVGKAITAVKEATTDTPKGKMPWERQWGAEKKAAPVTPQQPPEDKFEKVFKNLVKQESRGKHRDAEGNLIRSSAGAEGITQVMPHTSKDPGYGVSPMKDDSEKEYLRFGRDYLKAMLKEFDGDYHKALAAYNAGVGNVKKAVEKGGEKWKDHLPKKKETLPYVETIMKDV